MPGAPKKRAGEGKTVQYTTLKVRLYPTGAGFEHVVAGGEGIPIRLFLFEVGIAEVAGVLEKYPECLGKPVIFLLKYSMGHFYVADSGHRADPPRWLKQSREKLHVSPLHAPGQLRQIVGPHTYGVPAVGYPAGFLMDEVAPLVGEAWWRLRRVTVEKTRSGKFYCSILYEHEVKTPEPKTPVESLLYSWVRA